MTGLADITPNPLTFVLHDAQGEPREFKVRTLTPRAAGKIQSFLERLGPPTSLEKVRPLLDGLHPDVQRQLVDEARDVERSWPPSVAFNAPVALAELLRSEEGTRELLLRILEQADPSLSEAKILEYVAHMELDLIPRIVGRAWRLDDTTPVSRGRSRLVLLGPDGIEKLVQSMPSVLGVDVTPDALATAARAVVEQAHLFGTVIELDVMPEAVQVPKGEVTARAARRGPSASPRPTP